MTGFWKTDQIVTLGLIHFIGQINGYTRTLPRGLPLKVFDHVIRNQTEIPLDSKIPSRFTEDSTRFIYNVLRNFTNNLNYNSCRDSHAMFYGILLII